MLSVETIVNGPLVENTYFIHDEASFDGILIDPGIDKEKIENYLIKKSFNVKYILITHAHFDHIYSADYFRKKFNANIYVSDEDRELMEDNTKNESHNFNMDVEVFDTKNFHDGDVLKLLDIDIKCILTPGHTKGGTSYYIEKEKIIFTGDTLFRGTYGNPIYYSGDMEAMRDSLINKLFKLPDDVNVYPGHSFPSKIAFEKANNSIFNGY